MKPKPEGANWSDESHLSEERGSYPTESGDRSMDVRRWSALMKGALACAQHALPQDVPVGCIIVDDTGQVLAQGWNRREANTLMMAHAEMVAIQQVNELLGQWRCRDLTMVVTLEPCPMCASALLQAQFKQVIFGAWDPLLGALGSVMDMRQFYGHPLTVLGGIEEGACKALLQGFFQQRREAPELEGL